MQKETVSGVHPFAHFLMYTFLSVFCCNSGSDSDVYSVSHMTSKLSSPVPEVRLSSKTSHEVFKYEYTLHEIFNEKYL